MRHFTPKQLKDYLDQAQSGTEPGPLLLDVREPWEFDYCHIDGSVLIPMGELQQEIKHLDPQRVTIMICHHGIRSRQMGYYMEQMGFSNVINLDGGVEQWAEDVDNSMKRY